MATIKQLDDQISKLNVQKDQLTTKKAQVDQKIANLRKTLASSGNNPKQADNINKQITQLEIQKRAITGIDFEVNEDAELKGKAVVEEDGESITTGSYAGAVFPMPMGAPKNYGKQMNSDKKKKIESIKIPLLKRSEKIVNTYIDNLGGN